MNKKVIFTLILVTTATFVSLSQTIDTRAKGQTYDQFWSRCVGAGRANEGLRAGWLEQLKMVNENCGFKYVRFHGLFHDDMFVYFPKYSC